MTTTARRWAPAALLLLGIAGCGPVAAEAATPPATTPAIGAGVAEPAPGPPPPGSGTMALRSPDFNGGGVIPVRFTCKGAGSRPTLNWSGAPAEATSLAVVVTDPDAAHGGFTHWVVYDIPTSADGSIPGNSLPAQAKETNNSGGKPGWKAPCPPSGNHHYHFALYADRGPMPDGPTADMMVRIRKQAVGQAELIGTVAAKQ